MLIYTIISPFELLTTLILAVWIMKVILLNRASSKVFLFNLHMFVKRCSRCYIMTVSSSKPCYSNPCANGGSCVDDDDDGDDSNSYTCYCRGGYKGDRCEIGI